MAEKWNWKAKDGSDGGLLYESGNWGDLLKIVWLEAILGWKGRVGAPVNYLDTFSGDVDYPLGRKAAFRINQAGLSSLQFIRHPFINKQRWPSSASAARLLVGGRVEVFDADFGRRKRWEKAHGVAVAAGESGWDILSARADDPEAVWLVDPYDFLAEWRDRLPLIMDRARRTTILVYVYNRAARNVEAFREYRAFRNALEDSRGDAPKRVGRVAADVFLPRAHHELLFLPGEEDCRRAGFDELLSELERRTWGLTEAIDHAAAVDC